jgi:WD40 repeat protein
MLILDGHVGKVHALAFSPDGLTLAAVSGRSFVVWLWDLEERKKRAELRGHEARVVSLAFAPAGDTTLATADSAGNVRLWDGEGRLADTGLKLSADHQLPCVVCFAPDGRRLACTRTREALASGAGVTLWDIGAGEPKAYHTGHAQAVSCLAFAPDGRILATGGFDRKLHLLDATAPRQRTAPRQTAWWHSSPAARAGLELPLLYAMAQERKVHFLAFSPNGTTLASASTDGLIKLWDVHTGRRRASLRGQGAPLHALAFSPDGSTLASAGGAGTVHFWDVASASDRHAFDWGVGQAHSVAFAPDGMRAAAGGDGRIVVWDVDWDD